MKQIAQKGGWLGVWVVAGVVWTMPKRTFLGENDLPNVPREHLNKWNNASTFPIRLSNERARIRRQNPSREPQAVTSPAAPLQPDDERNSQLQQDVCLSPEMKKSASLTSMLVLSFAIIMLIFGLAVNKGLTVTPGFDFPCSVLKIH